MRNAKGQFVKGDVPDTAWKIGHVPWNKGRKGMQPNHNISGLITDGSLRRGKKFGALSEAHRNKISKGNIGKIRTPEMREKYRLSKLGSKNPFFGKSSPAFKKNAGYRALHLWVGRHSGTPNKCSNCGFESNNTRQFHWANISRKYKRDLIDWVRLCVKCHRAFDADQRQSQNH